MKKMLEISINILYNVIKQIICEPATLARKEQKREMKKKIYSQAELDIVLFVTEDIVTTSGDGNFGNNGEENPDSWDPT